MKADLFMRTPNTLFYSDKALFDELYFPRCTDGHSRGRIRSVTQLDKPAANQPSENDDVILGDNDSPPPEPTKRGSAPQPVGAGSPTPSSGGTGQPQTLPSPVPPVPGPSQPRCSTHERRVPTCPDNVYGDRHPTEITRDIARTYSWQQMVGDDPGSS